MRREQESELPAIPRLAVGPPWRRVFSGPTPKKIVPDK